MAIFQHNNQSIPYHMELAPFADDLILLQGSKFTTDFWRPVLADYTGLAPGGGRILICDWAATAGGSPAVFTHLMQTLGLSAVYVVACDDAVALIEEVRRIRPELIGKSLLYPSGAPGGEDLKNAIRAFCPV